MTIKLRYFGFIILFLLASCAQINPLTGGVDDDFSPRIDSAKTYPFNGQTNFNGDRVHLEFDEYIVLVKPNDNIVITPRTAINPAITSKNKTLNIEFNEALIENTTYTISFNRAVADLTEKNDSIFQFVFSTGNYIDSMSLNGSVTDGFTNKPSKNFLMALYPASTEGSFDSIPRKIKPTYIGQTDINGNFKMNYLKDGVYYVYAIDDKNKNMLLDPNEDVAFIKQKSILINNETENIILKSFKPKSTQVKITRVNFGAPGKLDLIFSNPADSFSISTSSPLLQEDTGDNDSLVYWLAQNPTAKMKFAINLNGELDTLKPLFKTNNQKLSTVLINNNTINGKIFPIENLKLTLSEPIKLEGINLEKIRIMKSDSTFIEPEFEIENLRTFVVKNKSEKPLTLQIDSAAFTSIYGNLNSTAQSIVYENHPINYFGSLVVNTDSVFLEKCIVYLIDVKGIAVDTVEYSKTMTFKQIIPGEYQLQLIIDTDQNGVWTNGSFVETRIPEKVIYFNGLITIKSKWEMELDWLLKGEN